MALGINNPQKEDDLAFMDQLLSSASSATGTKKEPIVKPASELSQVNDPDLQAMDQLIQSAQKGTPEVAEKKPPSIGETLQQSGFQNVSEELANVAKSETDPEEIKKFPQWFEKTPEQIDYLYAHRKNQSLNEAASKAIESAVGGAPAMVGSIATGFGQIISDVASVNPARMTAAPGGEEKAIRAIKAFPESVANTFEHLWRQGKNIAERGLTSADQALVSMGLKTEEEAKKNFRDREYFNTHNAQYDEENPDVAARAIDASRPVTQNALRAIVSNLSASVDQILAKHPDWNREQAVQYKNQQDEHLSQDYINRAIAYQNKTAPTEEELFATGLVVPAGNEFSMAIKAFEGAGKVIKFAGKGFKAPTAAEESAANAATQSKEALAFADRAKKKGDIGPVEKYAQIVADSISKGGQKLEQALESVPEFYRPMVKAYLPLASLELGGAGVGALAEPEDRVGGILKGIGLASTLYAPRVVADLAKARRTLAGAPGDMFSVAMATPESSLATKAISYFPSRKLPFLNESVINWTANNIKDFIRTGAETVPLGIALGVYNDQDAEGVGETLANGAIFAYSHGAITKATGKSPYEAQRYRKQKDYENYKLMSRLPEGDRAKLESAASWDEVIADSKAKLDESTQNYAELHSKNPESPETLKAADEVTKNKGIYEMNQRASVATRQEYTRQVIGVLSSADRRINGPISPGRNFNIRLMSKDEITQKLMDVNPGMDKATAQFFANNAGARYSASGQVKLPSGEMAGPKAQGVIFDPMRDTAVINMDKIRNKQSVTGRPLAWVLTHEIDHVAQGFKEYRDVTQPLREKLFGKKVYLPDGSVVPGSEGAYSTEMLNEMFLKNYLKTRITAPEKEEFAKNNNLWDYQKQDYDPLKIASYMQEEILAEANAAGLGANQVGGKGMARLNSPLQNIIDWALVSNENNRLAKVIKKGSFLGVKDPFITSALTGATFTPEMLAHVRRNNIALNEFNGVLTPHDGSDIAPEIKPNDIKNNRALAEEFAKDDGKFKTTKIGEVVDADGNVVYRHLITNPEAAEGEWKSSDDAERKPVRVKGYGQMPEELTTQMIPEGGSMRVVSQIVYDEKGKPVERDKNAYKALIQARSQMIRDAILKHDQDNPEAMRPFSADNLSLRGKLTQNQITEILNLPESIVPLSIKEKIAMARDIIDRGDGTPTIGMYASRLSSTGKYKPFSPKIVQSKPISLSFSKDGHFLVNEFNVTGARDKANLILKYQPEVLKPWSYDPNEFLKGLSKYMENWKNDPAEMDPLSEQAAQTRHRNLDEDFNKAMQMRYVYDAFLNVKPPKDEARPMNFNPVVITLPKIKRSQMTKDEKADFRSSDPMSLIRSRRLDAYSHYEQSNGTKYPFEYGKSIFNAMPEAQIDPEAALEMKPAKPSRETAPTISSPILRGINAIQGKDSGQMGSSFAPSGEKQSFGAQFTPEAPVSVEIVDGNKLKIGPVWHYGSYDANVQKPANTEGGIHFGTKTSAEERKKAKTEYETYKDDSGNWHWATETQESRDFTDSGFRTKKQAELNANQTINKQYGIDSTEKIESIGNYTKANLVGNFKRVRDVINDWKEEISKAKKEGYDGLIYKNQIENEGNDSYLVFDTNQIEVLKTGEKQTFGTTDPYVYHLTDANPKDFIKEGIRPSEEGYSGEGVYMGNTPENTEYYSSLDSGNLFRINKQKLIDLFGKYPENEQGIQFDEGTGEVLLQGRGNIPPNLLEYKDKNGKWKQLVSDTSISSPFPPIGELQPMRANFSPEFAQKYPTSEAGFYSQLQKTIDEKMPNKASVQQIMAIVDPAKGSGVKPDEIKWSNLEGFLEGKKNVTKQEVLDYLKSEGQIQFKDVERGEASARKARDEYEALRLEGIENMKKRTELSEKSSQASKDGNYDAAKKYEEEYKRLFDRSDEILKLKEESRNLYLDPKFQKYTMPEGKNYREVVMTMPSDNVDLSNVKYAVYPVGEGWQVIGSNGDIVGAYGSQEIAEGHARHANNSVSSGGAKPKYKSPHFTDIPNYVAHMRLNERSDADGNGLFIEELQSDRHQAGRKQGYKGEEKPIDTTGWTATLRPSGIDGQAWQVRDANNVALLTGDTKSKSAEEAIQRVVQLHKDKPNSVPDAPFRKDWNIQLFKRALRDAVDQGKDWIGWTSGEVQAERYDLSKEVEQIVLLKKGDGSLQLSAWGKSGGRVMDKDIKDESEIEDYIGKETAKKLLEQDWGKPTPKGVSDKVLEGQDIKVGGEGMKGFYDQILPKEVEKYVKKWGGKVEQSKTTSASTHKHMEPVDLPQHLQDLFMEQAEEKAKQEGLDEDANEMEFFNRVQELATDLAWDHINSGGEAGKQSKIWKVKITPEMRKTILEKGQPQAMTTQQQNTQTA
jgi:hypothetical protein